MVKREYEITAQYNTSDVKEISVDWNGNSYLVIYGKHINGGFFSIPNWGIGGELSRHFVSDMFDNAKHINEHLKNEEAAIQIAMAIAEVETFSHDKLKEILEEIYNLGLQDDVYTALHTNFIRTMENSR